MTAIHKKLAINDLPAIDYYDDNGHWKACVYEMYPGWWSMRAARVEMLSCFHSKEEAQAKVCFWLDITVESIIEYIGV
jgi:hypothetical protein